jgi:hypothetical protein
MHIWWVAHSVIRGRSGMVSLTGVPSGPSPKPRVHLARHDTDY